MSEQAPIVVVGAGLGGLAAACWLAKHGQRVVLLEKNAAVGGCASGLTIDGFRFDVGATMLEVPSVVEDFFDQLGQPLSTRVEAQALDPVYTIRFADGRRLPLYRSLEATAAAVAEIAPEDRAGFERYMRETDQLKRDLKTLFVTSGFARARDLLSRAGLNVFRSLSPFSSVSAHMRRLFRDPALREAFSFQVMYFGIAPGDCPAFYAMVPYFEITKGVYHLKGGLSSLAETLAALLVELGGELRRSTPVRRIMLAGGRVRGVELADGERLLASAVVSNADALYTYRQLVGSEELPARFRRRLEQSRLSCSTHLMLLGLSARRDDLGHHTFFLPQACEANYRAIFSEGRLPPELACYLCCPSRTDASMAPAGGESLYVLTPVPRQLEGSSWEVERDRFADEVLARLERQGVVGLAAQIESRTVLGPNEYRDLFNLPEGMTFGLQPTLGQLGPFRPKLRSPIASGLYLAGASSYPGAGVPLVISSGRLAAESLLADLSSGRLA